MAVGKIKKKNLGNIISIVSLFAAVSMLFACGGETMTDPRDGQKYKTVKIGNQVWMAENLNFKTEDSYCYEDKDENCTKYGRLYTWDVARKACPAGWHLPSEDEFDLLTYAVRGKLSTGMMLKSKTGWENGGNGVDSVGFSALPAGFRNDGGRYSGHTTMFWSSTLVDRENAYYMELREDDEDEIEEVIFDVSAALEASSKQKENVGYNSGNSYSVRCVKDGEPLQKEEKKGDVLKDADGNVYKMVKIGNQVWMAENLNVKTDNSRCYEDWEPNCQKYGRLYLWRDAMEACTMLGLHLPSIDEFKTLFDAVGGESSASIKLKSKTGWENGGNGIDSFGFSVLPAGLMIGNGSMYSDRRDVAYFWSSKKYHNEYYGMVFHNDWVSETSDVSTLLARGYGDHDRVGFSVRCVEDAAVYKNFIEKNRKFQEALDSILDDVLDPKTARKNHLVDHYGKTESDFSEDSAEGDVGNSTRSSGDIMEVVRRRTPGLRHVYNNFLKKKPGFEGKVTLKFTIAPSGDVINISIVSSTTGYGEFDAQIMSAVGGWTFNKVKSGNTTVTIPFTFSE